MGSVSGDRGRSGVSGLSGMNSEKAPSRLDVVLFAALALQLIISFHFLWYLPSGDEALHIYNAYRVYGGELPYRDFFAYVTPGTYLIGGAILALTGGELISLRITMVALAVLEIIMVRALLARYVPDRLMRAALLIAFVSVTALTTTYFSHHNLDNFLFVLLLYLVMAVRSGPGRFVMIGTVVGMDSLVHQAHGFYFCLAVALYIVFFMIGSLREKGYALATFAAPIAAMYLAFLALLVAGESLSAFFQDAIAWPASNYLNYLAWGIHEDTLFYMRKRVNLPEQALFLVSKSLLLLGMIVIGARLLRRTSRLEQTPATMMGGLVVLALVLGLAQTIHNFLSYFLLFFVLFALYASGFGRKWMLYLLLACLSLQIVRAVTHPARYYEDYVRLQSKLVELGGSWFYRSESVVALTEVIEFAQRAGIERAVVVGRSPEVYFLGGIRNPTRHDFILPVYLTEQQSNPILEVIPRYPVIYDRSLEKISLTQDFFDGHNYLHGGRLEAMKESALMSSFSGRKMLFENSDYVVYERGATRPAD